MYKPNRIGPYPLLDFDATGIVVSDATWNAAGNYNLVDGVFYERYPHFRSASVRDDFDQVQWVQDVAMSLADGNAMSFGVAISGASPTDTPEHFSGHVAMSVGAHELGLEIWCARVDAAIDVVRTAANNQCDSWNSLPGVFGLNGVNAHGSWCGSFLSVDNGGNGFGSNSVVIGASLINNSGGAVTIEDLSIGMSIHKYSGPLDTFDPER